MTAADRSEDAAEFARFVVAEVDRSGYGTPKPDRFMPTFDPLRLRGLAEAYLSLIGRDADAPNGRTYAGEGEG